MGIMLVTTALLVGLNASAASARAPERSTFTFHPVNPDLFAEEGMAQHCDFPVVGRWEVVGQETDFFDQKTGDPTRTVLFFHIEGTLSNPLTGQSIPNGGTDRYTIYFAADGSTTKILEEEQTHSPLLPIHAHFVLDPDGNIQVDVGHDDLTFNKHPFSIQPVCEALS